MFEVPNGRSGTVAHSIRTFLNQSENWIYPQVVNLSRYRSVVVCNYKVNTDDFPLRNGMLYELRALDRILAGRVVRHIRLFKRWFEVLSKVILLSRIKPCVVHSHFGPQGYEDMFVARFCRIPQVVSFYGEDLFRLGMQETWKRRYAQLFSHAALFVVEGPHMASKLEQYGCPQSKVRIRPHGVDIDRLSFGPCFSKDGVLKILVAGRLVEKKGMAFAVEAALRVMQKLPNVQLTLIGNAPDGIIAAKKIEILIEKMIKNSGLERRIVWIPFLPLNEFLKIAVDHDVFVQASVMCDDGDCEGGSPVILNQLAALGMAFVATRHCDIPEIVQHGINGLLVSERNVDELVTALTKILTTPEMRQSFARESRRIAEQRLRLDKTIEVLENIYDEALYCYKRHNSNAANP